MSRPSWNIDGQHAAKVKGIYLQPFNGGHAAVFSVEFDRNVEVNAKEFGFILDDAQLERLAKFINLTHAQQLITIPRVQ